MSSSEKIEALEGIFKHILIDTDKVMYNVHHTLDKNKDGYDCLAIQYNIITGEKSKRMFFEAVMSHEQDNGKYFIDKTKMDRLIALVNDNINMIYYVVFTPINTIVFNLRKIGGDLQFEEHNNRQVAYLNVNAGAIFDFIYVPDNFDAFPKDDLNEIEKYSLDHVHKIEPRAITVSTIENGVKLDENGEVTYETAEEFHAYPYNIKMRYMMENFLRNFLLSTEDKHELLEKYGTLEKLYKFIKERTRQRFLAKYGFFVTEPNKYEIK